MITPIWASRNTASSTELTPYPSGASQFPTVWEANAQSSYGNTPVLTCAPRYSSSVAMTRKIMARTSQAARVWEPKNRDRRPSLCGLLRSRITVNVAMPASTPTANTSSRNPSTAQCPMPGIAKVRENRAP